MLSGADRSRSARHGCGVGATFGVLLLQDVGCPDSMIRQAMGHEPIGVTARDYLPRRDSVARQWSLASEISILRTLAS